MLELPDPKEYRGNKEVYKRLRSVVIGLRSQLTHEEDLRRMVEFANVIHPGSFCDPGRLPFVSYSGSCKSPKPEHCLLAKVSRTILAYWDYKLGTLGQSATLEMIENLVEELEAVQKKGLRAYKVEGSEEHGYMLAAMTREAGMKGTRSSDRA